MDRKYGKGKGRRKGKLFALCKVITVEKSQNHPYSGKTHTVNHIKVIADDMKPVRYFRIRVFLFLPKFRHRFSREEKEGMGKGGQHIKGQRDICHGSEFSSQHIVQKIRHRA